MKKKLVLFIFVSLIILNLQAQLSVATTDNFFSSKVNPAAMRFGNAEGIGIVGYQDDKGNFNDDFSLYFNFGNLAYVYDQTDVSGHSIALSRKVFRNLYSGSALSWTNNKWKSAKWQESLLFRPTDCLSFGAVFNNVFDDDIQFTLGGAIRPFPFIPQIHHRVTLFSDFSYFDEKWQKPLVGLETELLNGLKLGAGYQMEKETFQANFSFAFNNLKIGSLMGFDEDKKMHSAQSYLHISEKEYKNFIVKPKTDKLYNLKISGKISEKNQEMKLGPITIKINKETTISSLINRLKDLEQDERISAIIIKSASFQTSFANYNELLDAFTEFKQSGKKVIFYFDSIGNVNYAFAAAVGDAIYLNPQGSIDLRGISATLPYVKNTLEKLGIEVVNFKSHEYKTAGNMFSEDEMTDAERESMQYLLDGLHAEMLKMIESGRGQKLKKPVQKVIDDGPYFIAETALQAGLIDKLIYEDQVEETVTKNFGKMKEISNPLPSFVKNDWSEPATNKIALIYAVGNIHMGKGKSGKSIGSATTANAIRQAREDKSVKGIIIRVDSGGGSALASDIIAREIALCNDGKNAKPVVISMAGAAASGGYYISAFADKIVAQPATITGSIGVIGIIPNFTKMYKKIGMNWSNVKTGEHADFASTHRPFTEKEKQMISSSIEHVYWSFTDVVAQGRQMTREAVHEIAQGRVWTGKQAKDRGLVDELGGMKKAQEMMKEIAGLKGEIKLVEFEVSDKSFEFNPFALMTTKAIEQLPAEMSRMLNIFSEMNSYENEKILLLMPYEIEE
jgi:protease-4